MRDYNPPKDLLANRNILVTGAGDGIGRVIAKAFAEYGATVILLGKTIAKLESVYDEIEESDWPLPAIYPLNLEGATDRDYLEMAETLSNEFGALHGLLHNAAQLRLLSRIDDYDFETWLQVMQVNLNGPFMMTQACMPLLRSAEDASVIFTSDRVGRKARAYWGGYAASKFGVEGLMQTLADETRGSSGIRVNSFDPGPTKTNMRAHAYPGEDPNNNKEPEMLINDYLWLMGPESIGTTGEQLSYTEPKKVSS